MSKEQWLSYFEAEAAALLFELHTYWMERLVRVLKKIEESK